ncbi:MAG: 50S ribosomal protein L3 [Puniceicoccales bacterium]|jgi:large subunit ribosomal protein L3|nr:50S ribosomal protein L3 [Puniceicoccales bacterium]
MKEKKRNILMIGKKAGMTQLYNAVGVLVPVTVVEMCRTFVANVKTVDSSGYSAVQFGFFGKKTKEIDDKKELPSFDILKELRIDDVNLYEAGTSVPVDEFAKGELVDVIGKTKGKGFQGVMKRHGFSGGPASHGSMFHRRGGSYGQRQWPGHVFKGRKMPGHAGHERRTVQNLEIVDTNVEKRLLIIKGSFPGTKGEYIVVRRAKKSLEGKR